MDEAECKILFALEVREMSGWEIGVVCNLSLSNLYPTLVRLEQEHKIESRWEETVRPRRRLYRLADA